MKKLTVVLMLAALVVPGALWAQSPGDRMVISAAYFPNKYDKNSSTKQDTTKAKLQAAMEEEINKDARVLENLSEEGKSFLNAIKTFRGQAERMLANKAWEKTETDPQEIIKTKTNFLMQAFIEVVDEYEDYEKAVKAKLEAATPKRQPGVPAIVYANDYVEVYNIIQQAKAERGALIRLLDKPLGEEKLVMSTFIRQHLSDCTHWHTITDAIEEFHKVMEQYVK